MSGGIGLLLSIAKDALAAQQYGIYVTGHNIANVNTPGYSKQSAVLEARDPAPFGGVVLGRGVNTTEITRNCDQIIENRVMQGKSDLYSFKGMENYMVALEGLFNENTDKSLSNILGDFWNRWHDIANNPSAVPERIALYEHSKLLSEQLNSFDVDLEQLRTDLTNALDAGVGRVNEITSEIASLNTEIIVMGVDASANDLKDQRNVLCSELAEYIDMKVFQQEHDSFTIVSAKGVVFVDGDTSYDLELDGTSVKWQGSGGNEVDITDHISKGKLGGFLEMRDEVVAKYKQDLTELASEFIWAVNEQHSKGAGLTTFSSATGTYSSSSPGSAVSTSASGLDYYDKVSTGTFRVYVYDSTGALANAANVTVTAGATTLSNIATAISAVDPDITATVNGSGQLAISTTNSHTFAFSNDTSGALAALGINTFFTGSTAGGIDINSTIASDKDYIAAAQIDSTTGSFATGDNTNAQAIADLQYSSMQISEWTYDRINGNTEGTTTATIDDYYHSLIGSLGIKASSIKRSSSFSENMVHELETMRDSISSVSLDEEMTQLMQYQHAYSAAAKLFSVADEMMQTLLAQK
ncbi:MAG: flagellar hook-associated protein FlgK [Desulfobacterales bacterium S7086C20]|nr:MAG: flagellar hook-associated protein FlgK [Desulfobacterales bacterium S7086C20]